MILEFLKDNPGIVSTFLLGAITWVSRRPLAKLVLKKESQAIELSSINTLDRKFELWEKMLDSVQKRNLEQQQQHERDIQEMKTRHKREMDNLIANHKREMQLLQDEISELRKNLRQANSSRKDQNNGE